MVGRHAGDGERLRLLVAASGRRPRPAPNTPTCSRPVVNAEEITAGTKQPDELGVKAVDDYTFEVTLNAPTPYFLEMLTHQATYAVSKANVEKFGDDFTKPGNLVSNGAYTLAEFIPNDHIKLVKNPLFYDAANVKIDKVNYIPTEDRSTAVKRFEAGELDSNDDFPTEQLADLKAKFGDQVRVGPYLGTYYYVFKLTEEPWSNPEVRHAISMGIDRNFLAESVWQNTMIPAYLVRAAGHRRLRGAGAPTTPAWISSTARTRRRRSSKGSAIRPTIRCIWRSATTRRRTTRTRRSRSRSS